MKKLFLALWPDETTRQAVMKISKTLNADSCKPVIAGNLHVTLVFIGPVREEMMPLIKCQVTGITAKPFVIQFDRLSHWRKPKILCLTSEKPPRAIQCLTKELNEALLSCGIKTDERPYKPHITLARKANKKPNMEFQALNWRADSFCLVESLSTPDGVHYQVLQRWPFCEKSG